MGTIRTSKHYRERAAHFREMAEKEREPQLRATLLKLARDYEGVADTLQKEGC